MTSPTTRAVASLGLFLLSCVRPIDVVANVIDAGADADATSDTDAAVPVTGPHFGCSTFAPVWVLGDGNALYAFDPASSTVKAQQAIRCPELASGTIRAMAVDDDGTGYLVLDSGEILTTVLGDGATCTSWGKAAVPPTADGPGLAIVGSAAAGTSARLFLGADASLYRAELAAPQADWLEVGRLAGGDRVRALMGTGDGRLFSVLSPPAANAYRVAKLDPSTAATGTTLLVPSAAIASDPALPAGFALYGDELLLLTQSTVTRYAFSTGQISTASISGFAGTVLVAASPPCASTLLR